MLENRAELRWTTTCVNDEIPGTARVLPPCEIFAENGVVAAGNPNQKIDCMGSFKGFVLYIPRCDGMKDGAEILERVMAERDQICEIAARHGARNVRIFGSVVRGEAEAESDLDLLIDLEPDRSLLDLVALESVLETLLGIPVDVAEPVSLHWYIRDRVMAEAVPL